MTQIAARRRPLALLALAGSAPAGVDLDRALGLLWPEFDETRARNNLKQVTFWLRQAIHPEIFRRDASRIALNPAIVDADVALFLALVTRGSLTEAVACSEGAFLAGFHIPGLSDFSRWIEDERSRLDYLRVGALERLAATADDPALAVSWRHALTVHDPLHDGYAAAFIRTLTANGDAAGALHHAELHAARLRADLDLEPGDETMAAIAEARAACRASSEQPPLVVRTHVRELRLVPEEEVRVENSPELIPSAVAVAPVNTPATIVTAPSLAPRRKLMLVGSVSVAVIAVVAAFSYDRALAAGASGERSVIALRAFDVSGPDAAPILATSVPEMLATKLDGALGIRALYAFDNKGARELRNVRPSGIAEIGGAILVQGDRIRIRAQFKEDPQDSVVVDGRRDALLSLVETLAMRLIASLFEGDARETVLTAIGSTTSLDAMRAWITGDSALARGNLHGAAMAFRMALLSDSTFALAADGASIAAERLGSHSNALLYARKALRFAGSLPPRFKLRMEANAARLGSTAGDAEYRYRALIYRFPGDVGGWTGLGELLFHENPARGRSAREAQVPFERALALDASNVSALVHLAYLASLDDDTTMARAYIARAERATSKRDVGRQVLHAASLDGLGRESAVDRERLETAAAGLSDRLTTNLLSSDREVAATAIARLFVSPDVSPTVRDYGRRLLAFSAAAQGRIGAAFASLDSSMMSDSAHGIEARTRLAVLDFIPIPPALLGNLRREVDRWRPQPHAVDATLDSVAHTSSHEALRMHRAGLLALRAGDTAAVERFLSHLQQQPPREPVEQLTRSVLANSLAAHLAAARGSAELALGLLDASGAPRGERASTLDSYDRLLRARLLEQLGRANEALPWYRSLTSLPSSELPLAWPAELGMARIYASRGEHGKAREYFAHVAARLAHADPEVQRLARDAAERARAESLADSTHHRPD